MIHEIGVELQAYFKSKKCPFDVIDGPEIRGTSTFARERVVIEHDPAGDSFVAKHKATTNPRSWGSRNIGVKITLYVKRPSKGATYWEHKRRAEALLDQVFCGLSNIAKERQNLVVFRSGKFIFPEDLKDSETPGGAAYELLLTFDRGIVETNWDGTAQPTATIGDGGVTIKNKTVVDATETACGDS